MIAFNAGSTWEINDELQLWNSKPNFRCGSEFYLVAAASIGLQMKWLLIACCIADIWPTTPFMMLMILAGLQGLDSSMTEAAKIDGANLLQQIFYIKLPVIKPVLLTALSVRIIDAARTFDIIWAMTEGGPNSSSETISIMIYKTLQVQ